MTLARAQDTRSTHKNQLHFYTLITTLQKTPKLKNTISLKISLKKMKCLGINLTKQVQPLHGEYYNNAGEINQRRRKWREVVFMDW